MPEHTHRSSEDPSPRSRTERGDGSTGAGRALSEEIAGGAGEGAERARGTEEKRERRSRQGEKRPAPLREEHSTPHGETPYSPVSMLRALTTDPLDVEELRGTDGRHEETHPPDTRFTRLLTVCAAVVLGFAVAVSAIDLRADAVAEDSPRALLRAQVEDSDARADELTAQQQELEDEIAALQETVLSGADDGSAERMTSSEIAAGAVALTGPGQVLTLDDSVALPATPGVEEGTINRVTDGDLQIAVNGLWAAGAEAVSINGQRITSTTAIRTAGSAVLVDFRALSPPYRITALGDPDAVRSGLEDGAAGEYLADISSRYGIRLSWESSDGLDVPARSAGTLREASATPPAAEAKGSPSGPAEEEDS